MVNERRKILITATTITATTQQEALRQCLKECGLSEEQAALITRKFMQWRTTRQQWHHLNSNVLELRRCQNDSHPWSQRRVGQLRQSIERRKAITAGHDPEETFKDALLRILREELDDSAAQAVFERFIERERAKRQTMRRPK